MKIRLEDYEIEAIRKCFREHFLAQDRIWLFGSRVDVNAKGGDIDLFIESELDAAELVKKRLDFSCDLQDIIGDQKIDIVLRQIHSSFHLDIYDVAKTKGVIPFPELISTSSSSAISGAHVPRSTLTPLDACSPSGQSNSGNGIRLL